MLFLATIVLLVGCRLLNGAAGLAADGTVFEFRQKDDAVPSGINMRQVFVFSTSNKNWHRYDWNKITTLVECGYHDDELLKYAHSRNVTVSYLATIDVSWLTNASLRTKWVKDAVNHVLTNKLDGINVDFETPIKVKQKHKRRGLTLLLRELSSTLKGLLSTAQITMDYPIAPHAFGRHYDYVALTEVLDFAFLMGYDERSLEVHSNRASANSPIRPTIAGIKSFAKLGIPHSKMVLGIPWYGYDYECSSYNKTKNTCFFHRSRQAGYSEMMELVKQSITGRLWDNETMSPYATYMDKKTGQLHQIWFDDVESLTIKYKSAKQLDLLGVGMWEADSLDYTDTPEKRVYVEQMWSSLPGRLH